MTEIETDQPPQGLAELNVSASGTVKFEPGGMTFEVPVADTPQFQSTPHHEQIPVQSGLLLRVMLPDHTMFQSE